MWVERLGGRGHSGTLWRGVRPDTAHFSVWRHWPRSAGWEPGNSPSTTVRFSQFLILSKQWAAETTQAASSRVPPHISTPSSFSAAWPGTADRGRVTTLRGTPFPCPRGPGGHLPRQLRQCGAHGCRPDRGAWAPVPLHTPGTPGLQRWAKRRAPGHVGGKGERSAAPGTILGAQRAP